MRRISERDEPESPTDLQDGLRSVYPRVVVRRRSLSNDDRMWYVYREGTWVDGRVPEWWGNEALPRLEVDREGFIVSANAAAGEEYGIAPNRLVHRHWTDFAVPGTLDDVILMREIAFSVGEAGGTRRHIRADGVVRVAEYRTVATESGTTITMRPIGATDVEVPSRPSVALETQPVSDSLFAVVVDGILSRIPEPTPGGLELRLRRSYPYASVDGSDAACWHVTRDPRPDGGSVDWDDPALARTVALDTSLIVEANEAALQLLGRDLIGRHWQELAVPSSLDQRLEMRDYYVANGGAESTFRLLGAGGELVDYDYRLSWEGDRFTTIMAPFSLDEPFRVRDARLILQSDGTIADANDAALTLYGATLAELQAAPPGTFSADQQPPADREAFRDAWESEGQPDLIGETTLRRLDGSQRRVGFGITRLHDGRFAAVIRELDAPPRSETKVFTAGDVLARWRAAERRLEALDPDSVESATVTREIEEFRQAYQRLFAPAGDRS